MSCRRSLEIELSDFLAEPRAPAFAAFREHYPGCPDCSAEVRAWTGLHASLSPEHPEPELLARHARLEPAERAAVDGHLAGCPSCREELRQLEAFAPQRLAAAPAAPGRWRARLAGVGRLAWSPAFAYALLVLALAPAAYRGLRGAPPLLEGAKLEEAPRAAAPRPLAASREAAPPAEAPTAVADADAFEPARKSAGAVAGLAEQEAPRAGRLRADAPADSDVADRLEAAVSEGARVELRLPGRLEVVASQGDWVVLRLPLPPGLASPEVRVRQADGRRELRQHLLLAPADAATGAGTLRLPRVWLRPGVYALELRRPGAAADEAPAAVYELRVSPP